MTGSAREEVLQRIRAATTPNADADAIAREWHGIERAYRRCATLQTGALLELFEHRLTDYEAGVYRVTEAELPGQIAKVLAVRERRRIAVTAGTPAERLVEHVEFIEDVGGGVETIDGCDGVLTGATLGIAETGTIVLQKRLAGGEGRRALTLLPDYHLCVVSAEKIVQTVPEAIEILAGSAGLATTFFSGPSATADIEMTRIKGVHGPRFVDVIVVV